MLNGNKAAGKISLLLYCRQLNRMAKENRY
nr:MAG TPA: hypothetical protein [Caudoviricetes sp.]